MTVWVKRKESDPWEDHRYVDIWDGTWPDEIWIKLSPMEEEAEEAQVGATARDVLRELREVYAANGGWPVRVRDLVNRSPSAVHVQLLVLQDAGLVEKGPGKTGWRPK